MAGGAIGQAAHRIGQNDTNARRFCGVNTGKMAQTDKDDSNV